MRRGVGIVAVVLAILTAQRVTAWQDRLSIWTAAARVTPDQPSTLLMLAVAQWDRGCLAHASVTLRKAGDQFASRTFFPGDPRVTLLLHWRLVFAGFHSSGSFC